MANNLPEHGSGISIQRIPYSAVSNYDSRAVYGLYVIHLWKLERRLPNGQSPFPRYPTYEEFYAQVTSRHRAPRPDSRAPDSVVVDGVHLPPFDWNFIYHELSLIRMNPAFARIAARVPQSGGARAGSRTRSGKSP